MITRLNVSSDGRSAKLHNQTGDVLVDSIPSAAMRELGMPSQTFWDTTEIPDRTYDLVVEVSDPGW